MRGWLNVSLALLIVGNGVFVTPFAHAEEVAMACKMKQTEENAAPDAEPLEWWYLRQGDVVETRRLDGELGERWSKNPVSNELHYELHYQFIDFGEQAIVDFFAEDLDLMGVQEEELWHWQSPLPERFETSSHGKRIWIEKGECMALADSPVALIDDSALASWRQFDFVDIGDMEHDPKVQAVVARMRVTPEGYADNTESDHMGGAEANESARGSGH